MPQRGRRVPVITERKQYEPGVLRGDLHPVLRQNITQVAAMANEQKGRGILIAEVNNSETGIANVDYMTVDELGGLTNIVPAGDSQPLAELVKTYDPDKEYAVLIIDSRKRREGQMWFDVFPRDE